MMLFTSAEQIKAVPKESYPKIVSLRLPCENLSDDMAITIALRFPNLPI